MSAWVRTKKVRSSLVSTFYKKRQLNSIFILWQYPTATSCLTGDHVSWKRKEDFTLTSYKFVKYMSKYTTIMSKSKSNIDAARDWISQVSDHDQKFDRSVPRSELHESSLLIVEMERRDLTIGFPSNSSFRLRSSVTVQHDSEESSSVEHPSTFSRS